MEPLLKVLPSDEMDPFLGLSRIPSAFEYSDSQLELVEFILSSDHFRCAEFCGFLDIF